MKNFGSKFNGKFLVVLNGNNVKRVFYKELPAKRWCIRYSVNNTNYVELWYQDKDGSTTLLGYWN